MEVINLKNFSFENFKTIENNNEKLKKQLHILKLRWGFLINKEVKIFNNYFYSFPILQVSYKLNDKMLKDDYYDIICKIYEDYSKIEKYMDEEKRRADRADVKKKLYGKINIENNSEYFISETNKTFDFLDNNLFILNSNIDKFKEMFQFSIETEDKYFNEDLIDEASPAFLMNLAKKRIAQTDNSEFIERLNKISDKLVDLVSGLKNEDYRFNNLNNNIDNPEKSEDLEKLSELFDCSYNLFLPLCFENLPDFIKMCEGLTEEERKDSAFIKIINKESFIPDESSFNKLCSDQNLDIINLFFKNTSFSYFVDKANNEVLKKVIDFIFNFTNTAKYFNQMPELLMLFLSPDEDFTKVLFENYEVVYKTIIECNFDKSKTIKTVYNLIESLSRKSKDKVEDNNSEDDILEF